MGNTSHCCAGDDSAGRFDALDAEEVKQIVTARSDSLPAALAGPLPLESTDMVNIEDEPELDEPWLVTVASTRSSPTALVRLASDNAAKTPLQETEASPLFANGDPIARPAFEEAAEVAKPTRSASRETQMRRVKSTPTVQPDCSADALKRGVCIKKWYQWYDPSTKEKHHSDMTQDVLHYRRGGTAGDLSDAEFSGSDCERTPEQVAEDATSNWSLFTCHLLHYKAFSIQAACVRTVARAECTRLSKVGKEKGNRIQGSVVKRAASVIDNAKILMREIAAAEEDCMHQDWNPDDLCTKLLGEEYSDTLMLLSNSVYKILITQPTLARCAAPCKIFGDTHGQLRDVLIWFKMFGVPTKKGPMFVFNGDFVDRGAHQLPLVGLLLALKVVYPDRVWLLRGNHEDDAMNQRYGFKDECDLLLGESYGKKVYSMLHKAFEQLPLGCVIADKIICVHGGIGTGQWTLHELTATKRPVKQDAIMTQDTNWLYNILWSDPIEDDDETSKTQIGVHESPRGKLAKQFSWSVTKSFLSLNKLGMVVRSHQAKGGGFGFDVMHKECLIRVFSARDYDGHNNDGAMLSVTKGCGCPKRHKNMLCIEAKVLKSFMKSQKEKKDRIEIPEQE